MSWLKMRDENEPQTCIFVGGRKSSAVWTFDGAWLAKEQFQFPRQKVHLMMLGLVFDESMAEVLLQ